MRLLLVLIGATWPANSFADLLLPIGDGRVTAESHRAILARSGSSETLIAEVEVRSSARQFVWLRPFPSEPRAFAPVEKPFELLRQATVVRSPYNELIRNDLFGPSIVTVLVGRLFREGATLDIEAPRPTPRSLDIGPFDFFAGQVTSSTTTYELFLPEAMQTYLDAHSVKLDQQQISDLAGPMNRGWTIAASVVQDIAPDDQTPAVLGPFGAYFRTSHTLYPIAPRSSAVGVAVPFDLFVIGDAPVASSVFETVWDVRPWENISHARGKFYVDYNASIDPESAIGIEVYERQALKIQPGARLMHMSFDHPRSRTDSITLVSARDPVPIPSGTLRGSGFDIFLCILLGLTPLLYTPESWFLLWLASRARARARQKGSAFGTRLWSVYAIVVGLYWFAVLPGVARIAGVVPLLIGIVQLALPYTERDAAPVRANLGKKRPKA